MAKTKKKPARAKATKPAKRTTKAAKPAKRRSIPKQTQVPGTEDPRADKALDALVHETYELTATWQAAGKEMKTARDRLLGDLKKRKIDIYETHQGMVVKVKHSKDSITITNRDKTADITLEAD